MQLLFASCDATTGVNTRPPAILPLRSTAFPASSVCDCNCRARVLCKAILQHVLILRVHCPNCDLVEGHQAAASVTAAHVIALLLQLRHVASMNRFTSTHAQITTQYGTHCAVASILSPVGMQQIDASMDTTMTVVSMAFTINGQ
jgi:hypothetical protein